MGYRWCSPSVFLFFVNAEYANGLISKIEMPPSPFVNFSKPVMLANGGIAPCNCFFYIGNNFNCTYWIRINGVQIGYGFSYDGNGGESSLCGYIKKGQSVSWAGQRVGFYELY